MSYLLIVAGLALLLMGGEAVVRGSVGLADRMGISPLIVGVTIVGFGTSLPEMVVSVNAALVGAPGLAIGNVVGSNIANILLILGVAALIVPIAVHPGAVRRDTICMVIATVVFCAIGITGRLTWPIGIGLIAALCAYIAFTVWHDSTTNDEAAMLHREEAEDLGGLKISTLGLGGIVVVGLFAVVTGAEWLVRGATTLAIAAGISEEVIGLTLVALGTSLPELATSVVAAYRRHTDVCVGNVLGSNIFNMFGISGITSLFATLPISDKIIGFDLPVLLGVTALTIPFMVSGLRMSRIAGLLLVLVYCAYVAAQFVGMSGTATAMG